MQLQALYAFSRTTLQQTREPVSFCFWSWLGLCVLLRLCCLALCFAVQIVFVFYDWEPFLEPVWYGLRLVFGVAGFCFLTPLWYRTVHTAMKAGDLTRGDLPHRLALFRMSLCLRSIRLLALLPLPFCLWGVLWCLQQGTKAADAVWWTMGAAQFVTLAGITLLLFFWLLPALAAVPVVLFGNPAQSLRQAVHAAFHLTAGKRKRWYGFCLRLLPAMLNPMFWTRGLLAGVTYFGVQQKEQQYAAKAECAKLRRTAQHFRRRHCSRHP